MTPYDHGWLIGIIEGDGCIFGCSSGNGRIVVSMTDHDTVAHIAALFGSTLLGPYQPKEPTKDGGLRKPVWVAQLNGRQAFDFLVANFDSFSERRQAKIQEVTGYSSTI